MKKRKISMLIVLAIALLAGVGVYADSSWLDNYNTVDDKLKALAAIQPGLGTVMIEYGNRYTNMYYAAKGGNWDLAKYQLKEAREIQEVGETTRPLRADALKVFESSYLDPIDTAIQAKDFQQFKKAFSNGISGCNGCHAGQGFSYIKYVLPKAPSSPLSNQPVTAADALAVDDLTDK